MGTETGRFCPEI
jgi:hypothetical protein